MYTSAEKKLILRYTKIFATVPDNILASVNMRKAVALLCYIRHK